MAKATMSRLFAEYDAVAAKRDAAWDKVYAHTDAQKRRQWQRTGQQLDTKMDSVRKRINALADAQRIPTKKARRRTTTTRRKR